MDCWKEQDAVLVDALRGLQFTVKVPARPFIALVKSDTCTAPQKEVPDRHVHERFWQLHEELPLEPLLRSWVQGSAEQ